jgi:hypothetical protein
MYTFSCQLKKTPMFPPWLSAVLRGCAWEKPVTCGVTFLEGLEVETPEAIPLYLREFSSCW